MKARLWPGRLGGRIAIVLIATVLLEFVVSSTLFEQAEVLSVGEAETQQTASALEAAIRVLEEAPVALRPSLMHALSRPELHLTWRPKPDVSRGRDRESRDAPAMRMALVDANAVLDRRALVLVRAADDPVTFSGTLRLRDGGELAFEMLAPPDRLPQFWNRAASVAILSGGLLIAALTILQSLGAPLRILAAATEAIGQGPPIELDERGPLETRRVARAFNAMQRRIADLIRQRTEALAAVSHDLRTPIARLRLRSGLLRDGDDAKAFEADLAEMEAMVAALLAFLGGNDDPEKPRLVDLAAMLGTLVDDATDAGLVATYDGPARHVVRLRSLAAKRALTNVINNALVHGGRADVTLRSHTRTMVTIEDDGPGIPADQLAAVFEPFHRLDPARTAGAGGMGLGLAIARQAVAREGGTIRLENKTVGTGLRVCISLPPGV